MMPFVASVVVLALSVADGSSTPTTTHACLNELMNVCQSTDLSTMVGCTLCASSLATCTPNEVDVVAACREAVVLAAPDPQDPPFDLTRVLFSGVFTRCECIVCIWLFAVLHLLI